MTRKGFAALEPPAHPAQKAPVALGPEGLERIRRYGMEPFIEHCREAFGPRALGHRFQVIPERMPEQNRLALFRLRDEDAFFLCRGLPAVDPERCYIRARQRGQTYYLEETQAPAALGTGYQILYCMLGKELAGAVYDSGRTGPGRWQAIGLSPARPGKPTEQDLWPEAL